MYEIKTKEKSVMLKPSKTPKTAPSIGDFSKSIYPNEDKNIPKNTPISKI